MRIVIDLQSCQSESKIYGIGRYSMSLAKAMALQAGNHEIWLVLSDRFPDTVPVIRYEFEGLVPKDRIAVFTVNGPVDEINQNNFWRIRTAEKIREYFLAGLQPDIVHGTILFDGYGEDVVSSVGAFDRNLPTAMTLYDLIPYIRQEDYLSNPQIKNNYFRKIESLKSSNLLLSISDYTKQEAVKALGINAESIVNISAAIESNYKPLEFSMKKKMALFNRYNITRQFIMYAPSGFDVRKNIPGLLKAYSRLKPDLRKTHQLLIVGKYDGAAYSRIIELVKFAGFEEDDLILTGYVPNDDLIALYNLCKLFVFPSFHEGFGLPILEAMACGAAVIGSNTTSIPEVIGRTDALFNPTRPEAITEMMQHVLTDEGFRQSLCEHGLVQAKKFSWSNSAKIAIVAFEELHERNLVTKNAEKFDSVVNYKKLLTSIAEIKATTTQANMDLLKTANIIAFNKPATVLRQLLVDISVLVHSDVKSGIQRVVRSILLELLKSPPQGYRVEPVYFDDGHYRYAHRFVNVFLGSSEGILKDELIDVARGDIYLGLDLSPDIIIVMHDYFKQLNILGVRLNFLVYDILSILHPEWWPEGMDKNICQWLKSIAEVSTGLVCISRSVANQVREWLDANPPNRVEHLPIEFFHLGADIENSAPTTGFPEEAEGVLKVLESAPSFLMVGTIEPRKGYTQALKAFEILWNKGLEVNLVIVGKRGWLMEKWFERLSGHSMLGKHLFWLGAISDEYLEKLYAASTCLLAASEAEGFGLPLIEAAQKKKPIIARDIPVFREVAGENAYYFSGMLAENLAQAIKTWLELSAHGKVPSSKGLHWLTWKESTRQLLAAIDVGGHQPRKKSL